MNAISVNIKLLNKDVLVTRHIQIKQCEHRATQQRHLTRHIQSKHEGVCYDCDQCEYQATRQVYLVNHIKVKHEGVRYLCDLCESKLMVYTMTPIVNAYFLFCLTIFDGTTSKGVWLDNKGCSV